ncbi:hypothetical protein [Rhizobium leguminosarum]|uniref:hypothetical protein n=1 Tax=Rhizobium leguminosarum TaxID=384 RepID=UPI001F164CBC|nr:hypothetical protein [Rhizobium leguminosarum]UIK20428.1 hypothetical protein LZK79_26330 [Rhizobium leguminosarum]
MASPRIIMKLKVVATRKEPGGVLVVELEHPRKPLLPAFEPGSHVDVHLPDGRVRQYYCAVTQPSSAATRSP